MESESALFGAILLLAQAHNWEQVGDLTPEQTALTWFDCAWRLKHGERCPVVGQIILSCDANTPERYLPCDGQACAPETYPELFAVLGYTFGTGDDDTFLLPNLQGRVALGTGVFDESTEYDLGATGGANTVELSGAEVGQHNHGIGTVHATALAAPGALPVMAHGVMPKEYTDNSAKAAGHENRPPYLALHYYIRVLP